MTVIAVTNQKGGVGKTTTTINLGGALAEQGQRILLVDLDPQGSLTAAAGCSAARVTLGDVLIKPDAILNAIVRCTGKMQIITATATLAHVLQNLHRFGTVAHRLKQVLEPVQDCYGTILIDCPPTLGPAISNALTAANLALIPLQCEFLSLRGLEDMQEIAAAIRETTNPGLRLRVLPTLFDGRTLHANHVLRSAKEVMPGVFCDTVIPRTVRLAEAPMHGKTILEYAPDSQGAAAYRQLAEEIRREEAGHVAARRCA